MVLFITISLLHGTTPFYQQLAQSAEKLTEQSVQYDPTYFVIDYPNGDVPADKGVCTDVVVRAYRLCDIDLQQLVHEDMKAHFDLYPNFWGLKKPDTNIDHRRVPNLQVFFKRHGTTLPITKDPADYNPGDIVCWDLGRGIRHIGIVVNSLSPDGTPYIVHNIGAGQVKEDVLFNFNIIGHYRYGAPH
jgi:hypothetical protein